MKLCTRSTCRVDSLAQPAPGYQDNGGPTDRQPGRPISPTAALPTRGRIMPGLCRNVTASEDYDEGQPPISAPAIATSYPRLFAGNDLRTGSISDPRECALRCSGRIDEKRPFPGRHRRAPGSRPRPTHFTASTGRGAAHEWEARHMRP